MQNQKSGPVPRTLERLLGAEFHADRRFATVRDLLDLLRRLLSVYELKVALRVLEEWADQPFATSGLFVERGGLLNAISQHGGDGLCDMVGIVQSRHGLNPPKDRHEDVEAFQLRTSSPPIPCMPQPPRVQNEYGYGEMADIYPPIPRQPYAPDIPVEEPPPSVCVQRCGPGWTYSWAKGGSTAPAVVTGEFPTSRVAPGACFNEEPNEFLEDQQFRDDEIPHKKTVDKYAAPAREREENSEVLQAVLKELTALKAAAEHSSNVVSKMWDSQQWLQAETVSALRRSLADGDPGHDQNYAQGQTRLSTVSSRSASKTQTASEKEARNSEKTQEDKGERKSRARPGEVAKPLTRVQRIVLHPAFEYFCAALILVHSGLVGLYVQYEATMGHVHPGLLWAQTVLTGAFVCEVGLKMASDGKKYVIGSEWKWNMFDCCILIMVFMEMGIVIVTNNNSKLKGFAHVAEMIRTARVLRILKFLRLSPTLQVILGKILASMSSLAWVSFLIFLLLYVAAVCIAHGAHEYLGEHAKEVANSEASGSEGAAEPAAHRLLGGAMSFLPGSVQFDIVENFGSVTKCFYSLFQSITGGELWGKFANILFQMHWLYFALFVTYIALVAFGVLNTVTGIFVDASMMSRQQQREQIMQMEQAICASIEMELREVFQQMDVDESGTLTFEELEDMMMDERVQMFLTHLKIDATDTKKLFQALEVDGSGEIEAEEFVAGIMRVKGEATSLDILQVLKKVEKIEKILGVMFKGVCHYHDGHTPPDHWREGDAVRRPEGQKLTAHSLANDSTL